MDVEELEISETILPQGTSLATSCRHDREGANEFLRREYQAIGAHAKALFFGGGRSTVNATDIDSGTWE
jgi:hypothetical protein